MTEKLTHHELTAELVDDNQGRAIMLTQPADNYDDPGCVLIHPWQLRAVCEQFGIVASDPHAEKTIATLKRRMRLLRDRIDNLHNYLSNHSDHRHADLSYEVTYATACIDLADEFCADLDDPSPVTDPSTTLPERCTPQCISATATAPAIAESQASLL